MWTRPWTSTCSDPNHELGTTEQKAAVVLNGQTSPQADVVYPRGDDPAWQQTAHVRDLT